MRIKGSLEKESFYTLLIIFVSLVFVGMVITAIFSGLDLQSAICKAVPWICGPRQDVDYEVSGRSARTVACAIGSVFLKQEWTGGSDFDCLYGELPQSTGSGGGSGGTADITAFAGSDEDEKLRISQLRDLQPSVTCEEDFSSCTVKNFIMPQEVSKWEDWIPYWGDPHYLMYWNSFPTEEDTWNFQVGWVHHVVIAAISIIPVTKSVAVGFKTFWTALKGPGKKAVAVKASQTIFKTSTKKYVKGCNKAFETSPQA